MREERRYTLAEARRELALEECAMHGHDFDVPVKMGGDPYMVLCSRCERTWWVNEESTREPVKEKPSAMDRGAV